MTTRRISYQVTPADYVHATRFHCWRTAVKPKVLCRRLLIVVVATVGGLLLGGVAVGASVAALFAFLRDEWGGLLFSMVLAFAWIPMVQQAVIPSQARRFHAQHKSAQLPHDMSWDRDGVILEIGGSRIVIPFADIHYWRESSQAILLYQNDMAPNFVMKRAFASADQLADFRAQLEANGIPRA